MPRYNKSAHQGRGDRADPSTWPQVSGPLDVVLFEGWMSGFAPLPADQASAVDPSLAQVNEALGQYKQAWDSFVDSWLVIRIGDPQASVWRGARSVWGEVAETLAGGLCWDFHQMGGAFLVAAPTPGTGR